MALDGIWRDLPTLIDLVGGSWTGLDLGLQSSFNPSIMRDEEGYVVAVRSANYVLDAGMYRVGGIDIDDAGATIRNRNFIVALNDDLTIRRTSPLTEQVAIARFSEARVQGFEDLRIFAIHGRKMATASASDLNTENRPEIVLLELDDGAIVGYARLSPDSPMGQKNWMPIVNGSEVMLVTNSYPITVVGANLTDGSVAVLERHEAPPGAASFRGGSQGLSVNGGYLFVVHEKWRPRTVEQKYVHRFVLLDNRFRMSGVSRRFSILGQATEFCAGLAERGDELILSVGLSDSASALILVKRQLVLDLLDDPIRRIDMRDRTDLDPLRQPRA